MEPSRYQTHKFYYILGLITLLSSLFFITYTLFLIPHLLFGWNYDVPEWIFSWAEWFRTEHNNAPFMANLKIILLFGLPGIILGIIADYCSRKIDFELLKEDLKRAPIPKNETNSSALLLKIILIIVGAFIGIELFSRLLGVTLS